MSDTVRSILFERKVPVETSRIIVMKRMMMEMRFGDYKIERNMSTWKESVFVDSMVFPIR